MSQKRVFHLLTLAQKAKSHPNFSCCSIWRVSNPNGNVSYVVSKTATHAVALCAKTFGYTIENSDKWPSEEKMIDWFKSLPKGRQKAILSQTTHRPKVDEELDEEF